MEQVQRGKSQPKREQIQYTKTYIDGKVLNSARPDVEQQNDETRSLKSEIDYSRQKKFVDLINKKKGNYLSGLGGGLDTAQLADDKLSTYSRRSHFSNR